MLDIVAMREDRARSIGRQRSPATLPTQCNVFAANRHWRPPALFCCVALAQNPNSPCASRLPFAMYR
ncbi:hypothetical protein [Ralstonia solanacearum]|uniref:hypothetical protein n=1 Tax=Ralstonia solanacearum TaxID=305 RepID=UPI0018D1869C|nr:hypothetical protein [Ralstonia solanacearum]